MSNAPETQPQPLPKPKKGFGITSMVLGILSILTCTTPVCILFVISAIVFFFLQKPKDGMTRAGLITAICGLVLTGAYFGNNQNGASNASGSSPSVTATPSPSPVSKADYQKLSKTLSYRKGVLKEYEEGAKLSITGKVLQKLNDSAFLISTGESAFGYVNDNVYVEFEESPKIIEDDIVRIFGDYNGTKEYSSVLGSNNEVPFLNGKFVTILQEK